MPPFVTVAVNVTDVPEHTGLAEATIDMLTARPGMTIIVMAGEVAGFPDTQDAVDVNLQVMTSLFAGVYECVALVAPEMFVPFFIH